MGDPHRLDRHGLGIIGLGNIARQYLATLSEHPAVRIVAVADLDAARAAEVAATLPDAVALDVDALLAHPAVETVLNLTIPAAHAEIALRAIAAGKQVYGEKPLAATLAEARTVMAAATAAGVAIGAAPDTVLGTGIQTARHAIDGGLIGRPLAATATMLTPGHERWHPNPDFYYRAGGGPLLDMGPYYVTALVTLLGPVVAVTGAASRVRDERTIGSGARAGERIPVEIDTHVTGVLEHENGALSTIVTSFDAVATTAAPIEVHGETGSLAVPDPNTFDGDVRVFGLGDPAWSVLPTSAGYEQSGRGVGLLDFVRGDARASGALAFHVLEVMAGLLDSAAAGTRLPIRSTAARGAPVPLTPVSSWRA
ncbi:Gfo/Idh/MocA family oxidoreductase [Microbacteriaceae bacterium VKM Ac-2854]|nr:Gfo/Idh/MocA family oxidoreductase [Microbacteriaceae bacterium VKM Ac-2854]